MIALSLHFLAGRYHATPWGRHVNEGAAEWPPSPWRLLRAIVATWKRTLPDLPESVVKPVLVTLAEPPLFNLPPASTGHSRHYMPLTKSKTLVFDTFVALEAAAQIIVMWPNAKLDESGRTALTRILANLNFLGRAESWCEARLLEDAEACEVLNNANCSLFNGATHRNEEIVRVLCADPNGAFADEYVVDTEAVTEGRGKSKSTVEIRHAVYDPNWHLCMETLRLHDKKLSDPPGSRWERYVRRADSFEVKVNRPPRVRITRPKPQVVRFALDSSVLPLVTDTLPVAEAARRILMGIHGRLTERDGVRGRSAIFSGKDFDGAPLKGHPHAYTLPTDEDRDGRLDHLTLVAADGFDESEMHAMNRLREIKIRGRDRDVHPLRVLLLGFGCLDEYQPDAIIKPSSVWVSATPFVATRAPKETGRKRDDPRFWRDRSEQEINASRDAGALVRRRVLADPHGWLAENLLAEIRHLIERRDDLHSVPTQQITIEAVLDDHDVFRLQSPGGRNDRRPIEFKRFRSKPGADGGRRLTGAFRIIFPHAVRGPISLGHGAHFGLGLFLPERAAPVAK